MLIAIFYEQALASAIAAHVRTEDEVVVVGGGHGVTACLAALSASAGKVICFEGDEAGVRLVKKAAELNGVSERLSVKHAIVAKNVGVYGDKLAKHILSPSELPTCDVLELDCEGAELEIIDGIRFRPRVIIVETHGFLGAPTASVEAALKRSGYETSDLGWAEPRLLGICQSNDVRVLVGSKKETTEASRTFSSVQVHAQ